MASARVAERAGLLPTAGEVDGERVWRLSRGATGYASSMTRASDDQRLTVQAPGGRMLDVLISGPEAGLPLVFHSGTPAGLVGLGPMAEAVSARGLRAVLYSRPGYGGSAPPPGKVGAEAGGGKGAALGRPGLHDGSNSGAVGGDPLAPARP